MDSSAAIVLTLPVSEVLRATPRILCIRLSLGDHPFPYLAGQAVRITVGEGLPARHYSIASTPADTARSGLIELLIRADDSGTAGLGHDASGTDLLHVGQRVRVEGPFGHFTTPAVDPGHAVLVAAGGTGIAPLRPMLRELVNCAEPRPITVVYSVRAADEFAYVDELQSLESRGALRLVLTVSRDDRRWEGRQGRVDHVLLRQALPAAPAAVVSLVCGPIDFVRDVRAALLTLGVPDAQILRERY
ncbi:MAG: FAD-dependent oxidoreductase [Acidobacteria bacterium]|nr:FAD-dependent oxidoreductase [Acidobacteriota bacterium]